MPPTVAYWRKLLGEFRRLSKPFSSNPNPYILPQQTTGRVKRRAGGPALWPSLLGLYQISLGRYTLLLTFSEEELFFSVPLSPDSPFLVVSAFVPPL